MPFTIHVCSSEAPANPALKAPQGAAQIRAPHTRQAAGLRLNTFQLLTRYHRPRVHRSSPRPRSPSSSVPQAPVTPLLPAYSGARVPSGRSALGPLGRTRKRLRARLSCLGRSSVCPGLGHRRAGGLGGRHLTAGRCQRRERTFPGPALLGPGRGDGTQVAPRGERRTRAGQRAAGGPSGLQRGFVGESVRPQARAGAPGLVSPRHVASGASE